MSLSEILGSAVSGLAASQAGMRTVANNIANVGSPGYARESTSLSASVTNGAVSGVTIGEPGRIADRFLEANAYARASEVGTSDITSTYLDQLQSLIGAPGSDTGLPAQLDAVGAAALNMTGSTTTTQTGAAFVGTVQDAIASMQQLGSDVGTLRSNADAEISTSVGSINALLARIHGLNDTIAQQTGIGRSTAGAADQRQSALDSLSSLIKVSVRDQPDGRVTIDSASGAVLLDKQLRQLSYPTSGAGTLPTSYPAIAIRFADANGVQGASTGEKLASAAVGGKLGGLIDVRDRALPAFTQKLGVLFAGLSETLNAASNAGTSVPAPAQLAGGQTGLAGSDRLGFTGAAVFAVTAANGTLVAKTSVDFAALGPTATIDTAVAAINAGLGGSATASFTNGKLVLTAAGAGNGVAVAQDPTTPSDRAGVGFSQFFGLNDLVQSASGTLVPPGFVASDPHGFAPGESATMVIADSSGKTLANYTMTGASGPTFGDLLTELNASPAGAIGSFALDSRGRIQFAASAAYPGAAASVTADTTDRLGTGRSFSSLSGLPAAAEPLARAQVRPDIAAASTRLPLAQLQTGVAVGGKAIGTGDNRNATGFVDRLATAVDLGSGGIATVDVVSAQMIGNAGADSARATSALADSTARRDDAVNRRDSVSGVNIDEELAQMVVLQNSYSAAARVISTASSMYDTLLAMIR